MDNKLTKKRLSNFFSYEWILMIIVIVVGIVFFDGIYAIFGVRTTTGQYFKVYYDQNFSLSYDSSLKLFDMIERRKTFSYDVLEKDYEILTGDADVLNIRLSVQEGDVIITDYTESDKDAAEPVRRADYVTDTHLMYTMDGLLADAKAYLAGFLKDGADSSDLSYANLDENKIDQAFLARMKKDNRYRTDEQKAQGKLDEHLRIQKLCENVKDFEYFLNNAPQECFYRYTRYSCLKELRDGELKENYEKAYQKEIDEGRQNAMYGIDLGALNPGEGETSAGEYFKVNGGDSASKAVLMAFDFLEYQPELQFESLSFFCSVLRECSDII